jgi:galactose-1-phosphate uridylyltransferase
MDQATSPEYLPVTWTISSQIAFPALKLTEMISKDEIWSKKLGQNFDVRTQHCSPEAVFCICNLRFHGRIHDPARFLHEG